MLTVCDFPFQTARARGPSTFIHSSSWSRRIEQHHVEAVYRFRRGRIEGVSSNHPSIIPVLSQTSLLRSPAADVCMV